jgi:hypothetical protein
MGTDANAGAHGLAAALDALRTEDDDLRSAGGRTRGWQDVRGRGIAIAVVGLLVLVIGAPAGASVSSFTKKSGCDLITEDDIAAIFGEAPTQTTEDGKKRKFFTCTWTVPTPDGGSATVFIGLDKPNTLNKKDFKEKSKLPEVEKVAGIKKGYLLAEGNVTTVTFVQHGNHVNVQYLAATGETVNTDGLIDLAKELYKKL